MALKNIIISLEVTMFNTLKIRNEKEKNKEKGRENGRKKSNVNIRIQQCTMLNNSGTTFPPNSHRNRAFFKIITLVRMETIMFLTIILTSNNIALTNTLLTPKLK